MRSSLGIRCDLRVLPACFHRLPIYTFVGKLFAESGENSAFGPTTDVQYSFQRIETFGGGRIRKKKGKGRKAWIGKLRVGRIKRTTKWGKRDTKEERMRIYTERARRMQNTRVERRRRSVHLRVNWLSSSFSRNHLL